MGQHVGAAWATALALVACGSGSGAAGVAPGDATAAEGAVDGSGMDSTADRADARTLAADSAADAADDTGQDAPPGADAGDDGEAGLPPLTCTGDAYEPNDTQVTATPLPGIDDCDSSGSTVTAVSSGTGDPDWMHYFGTDTVGCVVDPTAQIDAAGLRLCIFIICPTGITTIQSCTNGSPGSSPADTPGCCTTSTTAMTVQMSCGGTSDSADVYIRVDQPDSNQCVPYDVAYHF